MRNEPTGSAGFIGLGGVAVSAFLYGYVAVVSPSIVHSVLLPLLWVLGAVLAGRWFVRRPLACASVPIALVALWFVVLLALR